MKAPGTLPTASASPARAAVLSPLYAEIEVFIHLQPPPGRGGAENLGKDRLGRGQYLLGRPPFGDPVGRRSLGSLRQGLCMPAQDHGPPVTPRRHYPASRSKPHMEHHFQGRQADEPAELSSLMAVPRYAPTTRLTESSASARWSRVTQISSHSPAVISVLQTSS
jgi:hypothetical protein